jgi:hypothetical protein
MMADMCDHDGPPNHDRRLFALRVPKTKSV